MRPTSMRRGPALLFALALAGPARAGTNQDLVAYYGAPAHYRAVRREVLRWHRTTRNGCVAFVSTALRHIGVPIPRRGYVWRITLDFSRYLEEELGWTRVAEPGDLEPGDLVFTADAACCPGYPAHVFVVHSWVSRARLRVRAIDNQGLAYGRALRPERGDPVSPFAYGLRAPGSTVHGRGPSFLGG